MGTDCGVNPNQCVFLHWKCVQVVQQLQGVNVENSRLRQELTAQASFSCELQELLQRNAERMQELESTVQQLAGGKKPSSDDGVPWGQALLQRAKGGSTVEDLRHLCDEMQSAVKQCARLWYVSRYGLRDALVKMKSYYLVQIVPEVLSAPLPLPTQEDL